MTGLPGTARPVAWCGHSKLHKRNWKRGKDSPSGSTRNNKGGLETEAYFPAHLSCKTRTHWLDGGAIYEHINIADFSGGDLTNSSIICGVVLGLVHS